MGTGIIVCDSVLTSCNCFLLYWQSKNRPFILPLFYFYNYLHFIIWVTLIVTKPHYSTNKESLVIKGGIIGRNCPSSFKYEKCLHLPKMRSFFTHWVPRLDISCCGNSVNWKHQEGSLAHKSVRMSSFSSAMLPTGIKQMSHILALSLVKLI